MNLFFVSLVQCTLDVHAIDELKQSKGLKPTDDLPKYDYDGDEAGNYGNRRIRGKTVR
jgi:hypothetical protein